MYPRQGAKGNHSSLIHVFLSRDEAEICVSGHGAGLFYAQHRYARLLIWMARKG